MRAARKLLRDRAKKLLGDDIGCYDGSCVFGHPGGVQTNGGCDCLDDRMNVRKLERLVVELAEELSERGAT